VRRTIQQRVQAFSATPASPVRADGGFSFATLEESVMSWTDERVEQLRKLWMEGLSASQIANTLGDGVTRNAVIGKVHRLGLSGRVKAQTPSKPRTRSAQPSRQSSRPPRRPAGAIQGANALAYAPRALAAPEPAADVVVPMSTPVTIMELKEDTCRFPLGDPSSPDFRYCGAKSELGVPYCPFHTRLAYQPAQERRRERDRERRVQMRAIGA